MGKKRKDETLASIYNEYQQMKLLAEKPSVPCPRFCFTLDGGVLLNGKNLNRTSFSDYRRRCFLRSEGNHMYILVSMSDCSGDTLATLSQLPLKVQLHGDGRIDWSDCVESCELLPSDIDFYMILHVVFRPESMSEMINVPFYLQLFIDGEESLSGFPFFLKDFGHRVPILKLQSLDFLLHTSKTKRNGKPHVGIPVGWKVPVEVSGKVDADLLLKGMLPNGASVSDFTDAMEFECLVFDEGGREILSVREMFSLTPLADDSLEVKLSTFLSLGKLPAGEYICAIYFLGKPWVHAPFSISAKKAGSPKLSLLQPYSQKIRMEENALDRIQSLVGLTEVKHMIQKNLHYMKLMEARKSIGLSVPKRLLHVVMTGNPGTGKTTVARLLGTIYHEMGVLSKGHLVEVNRDTLVDSIIGGSEKRTREAVERARGGVLFVDEAYSLTPVNNEDKDFGRQVLDTLLPELSDPQDLVVVFAGYEKEMEALLRSNPGLASRFPVRLRFADFSADELMQIADNYFETNGFCPTVEAQAQLRQVFVRAMQNRDFGNGRFVKTFIENEVLPAMADRLSDCLEQGVEDARLLSEIVAADIPPVQCQEGGNFQKRRSVPVVQGFRTGR